MIGNHPNVQKLLGASHDNKYCYLPFLPNCSTLDAILGELMDRKEACDTLQVLTIAEGIANGMKCLHTATVSKPAILHCVLTPRAILVCFFPFQFHLATAADLLFNRLTIKTPNFLPSDQLGSNSWMMPCRQPTNESSSCLKWTKCAISLPK